MPIGWMATAAVVVFWHLFPMPMLMSMPIRGVYVIRVFYFSGECDGSTKLDQDVSCTNKTKPSMMPLARTPEWTLGGR